MAENFDTTAVFRCKHDELQEFKNHCKFKLKRPYTDVLREMMIATPDGRLKIIPTEDQKKSHGEIYDVN